MTVRIVAVDDEPLALRGLEHLLREMDDVVLVGTANGVASGRRLIAAERPDVVLLDIRMRDGSGLDLAEEVLDNGGPAIVFVSAYDRYAARAFDLAAADYVLKPAEPERLRTAITRARSKLLQRRGAEHLEELKAIIRALRDQSSSGSAAAQSGPAGPELWVRRNQREFVRLDLAQVDSVEAEGDYVRIHLGERSYLHRTSISAIERQLEGLDFARVHRAALVRFGAVARIRRTGLGALELVLTNGRSLRSGRVNAKRLRERIRREVGRLPPIEP